jgi:hypothetical protein
MPRYSKEQRAADYQALQQHRGYERLTGRQQEIIDCFAAGMGYVETGKLLGVKHSAPWSILVKTILPRYKPGIWKIAKSLPEAIRLLAKEARES